MKEKELMLEENDIESRSPIMSYTVSYYITSEKLIETDDLMAVPVYGIKILKTYNNCEGEIKKDAVSLNDVSFCIDKAGRILKTLSDNEVTPNSFSYVVSDILKEEKCCGSCSGDIIKTA